MSSTALAKAEHKYQQLKARLTRANETTEEVVAEGLGVLVGVGAGFALGAAEEKWGEDALFGTSVPAVVGLLATGAALAGMGGGGRMILLEAGKAGLIIEGYKGGSRVTRDWMAGDTAEPTP